MTDTRNDYDSLIEQRVGEKMIDGLREFTEDLEKGDISEYRATKIGTQEIANLYSKSRDEVKQLREELALYKEKTPHTADGVPIFIGDVVWVGDSYEEITWGSVSEMMSIDDADDANAVLLSGSCPIADLFDHFNSDNKFVYSTREALEQALKGGE